jgi:putative aldouronate transport system substrate-binding protein
MKRIVTIVIVLAAVLVPVLGTGQQAVEEAGPLVIKVVGQAKPNWGGVEDNKLMQHIEEQTNVDLQWEIPPTTSYYERLNVIMASGDLPDLIWSAINENYWNWVDSGLVMALDEYFNATPNIGEVVSDALFGRVRSLKDGKLYGIPKPMPVFAQGIYWRKDWLDQLGMDVPETLDEAVAAWKGIVASDFDGNGKQDTYGFTMMPDIGVRNSLFPALDIVGKNRTGGGWMLHPDTGKVIVEEMHPDFMKGILFLRDLYTDGIIDKEYILNKGAADVEQKLNQGIVGSWFSSPMKSSWSRGKQKTEEVFPEAEVVFAKPPESATGNQGSYVNPANDWGVWFLTVAVENPEGVMQFMDTMHTWDWWMKQCTGVEGIHYTSYDSATETVVRSEEQAQQWKLDYNPRVWFTRRPDGDAGFYARIITYQNKAFAEAYNYNTQTEYYYSTVDAGYYPADLKQLDMEMPEWRTDIQEVLNKIIIGEAAPEEFDLVLERILKAGLSDAVAEMQEYYDKQHM